MDGVGLPEKAKTYQKSPYKRTVRDKNGQNTKMEDVEMEKLGSYKALSAKDDPSGRSWWPEGLSCALKRHPRVDAWWLPWR